MRGEEQGARAGQGEGRGEGTRTGQAPSLHYLLNAEYISPKKRLGTVDSN